MKTKTIYGFILLLFLSIILNGCWGMENSPEDVVVDFFSYLEKGELGEAKNQVYSGREDSIFESLGAIDILEEKEVFQTIFKEYYSIDILDIEVEAERAIVQLEITSPPLGKVIKYYMNKRQEEITNYLLGEISKTELEEKKKEILLASFKNVTPVAKKQEVFLQPNEKQWKIHDWSFESKQLLTEELREKYKHFFVTKPEETISLFWFYFKNADFNQAEKYIYPGRKEQVFSVFGSVEKYEEVNPTFQDMTKKRFLFTTYGSEINNKDKALVDLEITMPDLRIIYSIFSERFTEHLVAYYREEISETQLEKRMNEIFIESVKEADTVSYREEAILRKHKGDWKIYNWNLESMQKAIKKWVKELEDY